METHEYRRIERVHTFKLPDAKGEWDGGEVRAADYCAVCGGTQGSPVHIMASPVFPRPAA